MNLEDKEKTIISTLNSRNFHLWIKKIKDIVFRAKVWEYVDSEDDLNESKEISFSHYSHYSVLVQQSQSTAAGDGVSTQPSSPANQTVNHRSTMSLSELTNSQKESLRMNIAGFDYRQKIIDRVIQDIRIVDNAVKTSAKDYISSSEMMLTTREILQSLSNRSIYQRTSSISWSVNRKISIAEAIIDQR